MAATSCVPLPGTHDYAARVVATDEPVAVAIVTFMATHAKTRDAPRFTVAARDQYLPAGPAPGSMMTLHETVPSPARIGLDLIAIEEGAPLELDLRIESVSEGVLVTGTVSAPTAGECVRCLTPVTGDVEIDLTELFAYPESTTDETTDADELGRVVDQNRRPGTADH